MHGAYRWRLLGGSTYNTPKDLADEHGLLEHDSAGQGAGAG